jgi:hypothetical protein
MKSRPSGDSGAQVDTPTLTVQAPEPLGLVPDVAGFFVVHPDARRKCLVVEHYTTAGGLGCAIEDRTPAALWNAVIERHLVSRLDHAVCLGVNSPRPSEACRQAKPTRRTVLRATYVRHQQTTPAPAAVLMKHV